MPISLFPQGILNITHTEAIVSLHDAAHASLVAVRSALGNHNQQHSGRKGPDNNSSEKLGLTAARSSHSATGETYTGELLGLIFVAPFNQHVTRCSHVAKLMWQVVPLACVGRETYSYILHHLITNLIATVARQSVYSNVMAGMPYSTDIEEHVVCRQVFQNAGFDIVGEAKMIYDREGVFADRLSMQRVLVSPPVYEGGETKEEEEEEEEEDLIGTAVNEKS